MIHYCAKAVLSTLHGIFQGLWLSVVNTILKLNTALLYFAFCSGDVYESYVNMKFWLQIRVIQKFALTTQPFVCICLSVPLPLWNTPLSLFYVLIVAIIVTTSSLQGACPAVKCIGHCMSKVAEKQNFLNRTATAPLLLQQLGPGTRAGKGWERKQGQMDSSVSRSQVHIGHCPCSTQTNPSLQLKSCAAHPTKSSAHHELGQGCLQRHCPAQPGWVWPKITFPEGQQDFETPDRYSVCPLTFTGSRNAFTETLHCISQKLKCPVTRFSIL